MTDLERREPDDVEPVGEDATAPTDPAGTRPRHRAEDLLPSETDRARADEVVDGVLVEEVEAAAAAEAASGRLLLDERTGDGEPADVEIVSDGPAPPPHAPRFQFLTGALLAFGVAAVFAVVGVIIAGGKSSPRQIWSAWKPSSGTSATEQIADHVGERYKLGNGRQLVLVSGGPLEVASLPLTVALRNPPAAGGDVKLFDDKGVLYRLCGLAKDCAISGGKPSSQRHLLLRREALELAMYSFHYLSGVKQVVVFMPPPLGQQPSQALFFRKGELADRLDKPLDATLAGRVPVPSTVSASPDSLLVQELTLPTLFKFSLTQANTDNRAFLVLDPFDSVSSSGGTSGSGSGSSGGSSGGSGSGSSGGTSKSGTTGSRS